MSAAFQAIQSAGKGRIF